MQVKDDFSLSPRETIVFKEKLESKNREILVLQEKIAQQNQEIINLRQQENKKKYFFFRIKQVINQLIKRNIVNSEENFSHGTKAVIQYPEIVLIKVSDLFDDDWYLSQYPDVAASGMEPAQHYLRLGAKKGYNPSPDFSTRDYRFLYPDVGEMNPLLHYEVYGKAEGRICKIEKSARQQFFLLEDKIKIIFISGDPDTPGHTYRISRYAHAAKAMGAVITELTVPTAYKNLELINDANLLIVWRATWSDQLLSIYNAARKTQIPIVFDIDDLLIDPNLAKIDIVDGIRTTGSTEEGAEEFFESLKISMEYADYCSAPTHFLAHYMRSFGKKTFRLPNGFDERTWQASRLAVRKRLMGHSDGLIRIGYAGGSRTHQKDFAKIANVIARLLKERPHCRLVLFRKGTLLCTDVSEFPALFAMEKQIEWKEVVPLTELPYEMAKFDINLAPLEVGNAFCEAKSELKFFESALVEVPVVASPTQTFSEAIEDGKTGFLATDENSWYAILSRLLDNAALRKQIGRQAYYNVLWKYGGEQRMELFASMLDIIFYPGARAARAFELDLLKSKNACYKMPNIPAHEIMIHHDKLNSVEVTIVVPFHNDVHLVERLECVKAQTLLNIDLIIVDDCSMDHFTEIASQWIKEHKDRFNRIMLIKNRNRSGLGLTKNVGFSYAETLFVNPLNPNDRLNETFATNCVKKIKETSAAFVYPHIFAIEGKKHITNTYDPILFANHNYVGGTALIRLAAWAHVGGYHELDQGAEDDDFMCKLVEYGLFGDHVNEILKTHQVHETYSSRDVYHRHPWLWPLDLKEK